MIKPICKDVLFLGQPSESATKQDKGIIADLKDTLAAHQKECVGMAANMIGYKKRMIVVSLGIVSIVMINPVITQKSGPYETEEGCLSLAGKRHTKRFKKITVEFENEQFEKQTGEYEGFIAQIIQHECDHLEGIII